MKQHLQNEKSMIRLLLMVPALFVCTSLSLYIIKTLIQITILWLSLQQAINPFKD
jgi:hypothetical protein